MTDLVGGLRSRFIHDSFTAVLQLGLAYQGWFDTGRSHKPIRFLHGPHPWDVPVDFNVIVVTTQNMTVEWVEVGSNLTTSEILIDADLYAESESLGVEVANDMREIIQGRLPGGATRGTFPILDFRQATPSPIGYASVDDVILRRVVDQVPEEWARHVFQLHTTIQDTYY